MAEASPSAQNGVVFARLTPRTGQGVPECKRHQGLHDDEDGPRLVADMRSPYLTVVCVAKLKYWNWLALITLSG
jgi:hypothetical protein